VPARSFGSAPALANVLRARFNAKRFQPQGPCVHTPQLPKRHEAARMLYAILCYNSEKQVFSWTKEQDDAVMARLSVVHQRLAAQGKLGPAARLEATSTATTLLKGHQPPLVVDGPFAETKEALLGFYMVDVESKDEAVQIAKDLEQANPGVGAYEVRPVRLFLPGNGAA
jgi:hypothetical protein